MKKTQKYLALQILKMVEIGALFTTVSILSPTFVYGVLKRYLKYKLQRPYKREQIRKAVAYLKRKQFIAYPAKSKDRFFFLTKAGKERLLELKIQELKIEKTSWDKKWRLVAFDIPESATPARFRFRRMLKNLGFYHLQRSVFILPYPCEKQIHIICNYLKIQPYIHIFRTDRFPNDKGLIKHFRLN